MKLFLFLLLIPSLSFGAVKAVTGEYEKQDTVVINRNFRELQQEVNNKVDAKPFTLNGTRSTGSTTPTIGTNAPALVGTAPYKWVDVYIGTVPCVMPVWRKQ